ncbi:MAG: hypothetical protein WC350_02260 [Candidatus Micrarchaeia archaeon]|jgi:hypothetical protein
MAEHKTPVPLASMTPTRRSFPAVLADSTDRPGRYRSENPEITVVGKRAGPAPEQPADRGSHGGADALKLFVKGASNGRAELPAVSPKSREDQYGFPIAEARPVPAEGRGTETAPKATGFFKVLRGAHAECNTIPGLKLEDLGYAEKVPNSNVTEELQMRDGSPHRFSGFMVQLGAGDSTRRFMFSNTPPNVLADHGATGYLVTSDYMQIELADGRLVYIIAVCEDASALKLTGSPREGASAASGQIPLFDNTSEAVRWVARKVATLGDGTVKKQILDNGRAIVLVETPEGSFIVTNGSVEYAIPEIAKACGAGIKEDAAANPGSVCVALQSGETVHVRIFRIQYLSVPEAETPPAAVSPSTTGTTEASLLITLDVGLPQTKEGAAALLTKAIRPTPAVILAGEGDAEAEFISKRRILTSIREGLRSVIEHNDAADPLIFTAIRTRMGGNDFTFHLFKLRSIDGLSPALRDMQPSIVFTEGDDAYILLPSSRISPEVRKLLLESTMTR